ncbi:recombinase family protein [Saccharothrix tamanrassetensis]|uniref:recombinase family protein n=1 Tax=Saccharothrix tamanrassetensis TaxID=1051531 RepID=UPI0035E41D15
MDFDDPSHEALLSLLAARSQTGVLGSGTGSSSPCGCRRSSRGATSVTGRPTAAVWSTPGRIRTGRWRVAVCGGSGWCRTRPRHPWWELICSLRLAGHSAAGIVRHLNERSVPSSTGADPARNGRRDDHGWSLRTVVEVLGNPRYTGHRCGTARPRSCGLPLPPRPHHRPPRTEDAPRNLYLREDHLLAPHRSTPHRRGHR